LEELKRSASMDNSRTKAPLDLDIFATAIAANMQQFIFAASINNSNTIATGKANKKTAITLPPCLEIRNLSFSYPSKSSISKNPNQKLLLRNISLTIPSGGYSVGLCGPSGSGKSTLLRVLLGLESIVEHDVPSNSTTTHNNGNQGSVLLYGQDLTRFNRVPFFSLVGQESDLFRGLNLMENVQYGAQTLLLMEDTHNHEVEQRRMDNALRNAASDAHLWPVVEKQKDGWRAAVGPRGRLLSGGERQRVSIARALYRQEMSQHSSLFPCYAAMNTSNEMNISYHNSITSDVEVGNNGVNEDERGRISSSRGGCILLMDEVTASLDANAENIVTEAIMQRVQRGTTALLVAHRLSSLQKCNLILVMRDGEIVESGSHVELLRKKGGWYAEAWRLQSTTK